GGLSERELDLFKDFEKYKIAENRLRSETAIIKCAALL
ncbi:MAG: 16S rRNA (uracil(1498)-N(3))-methyltransferase, partial [Ignavibacteriaceae bacterium]